ncbi:hypothetical protein Tco_0130374, partial [Tanacetum coccineum]
LMALSIADQIALDDALVAPADRLKIGKCNLRLSSDVTSKEVTLQVVYDVLKLTPNEATQLYGAILPVALTNEDIRNSKSYKEYYAIASGIIPPKTKGNEGTGVTPGVPDAPDYDSEDDISWKSSNDDQDDEQAQDDEDAGKNDVNETTRDDKDDDDHDVNETTQDDEDDDDHDDDEKVQDDD